MPYLVKLAPEVEKQLAILPRKIQRQVVQKMENLAQKPRPQGCKRLKEAIHLYRIRSGDYRILYQIEDDLLIVLVVRVADRKEVYRILPTRKVIRRADEGS